MSFIHFNRELRLFAISPELYIPYLGQYELMAYREARSLMHFNRELRLFAISPELYIPYLGQYELMAYREARSLMHFSDVEEW